MASLSCLGTGACCWPDLSSWPLTLKEANLASLPGSLGTGRKGRPQCISMFQASARVPFANIPGANTRPSMPHFRVGEVAVTSHWEELQSHIAKGHVHADGRDGCRQSAPGRKMSGTWLCPHGDSQPRGAYTCQPRDNTG